MAQWKWKFVSWGPSAEWVNFPEETCTWLEKTWIKNSGKGYHEFIDTAVDFNTMKIIWDTYKNIERYGWEKLWKSRHGVRLIKRED